MTHSINFLTVPDVGMVSKFSLFIRPSEADEEEKVNTSDLNNYNTSFGSFYSPVTTTTAKHNDYAAAQNTFEHDNDDYHDYTPLPMNVVTDDLGGKEMSIEVNDYVTTSLPELSNNINTEHARNDDSHKPFYVDMKDYSDKEETNDYPAPYSKSYNEEEIIDNEIQNEDNNVILSDKDVNGLYIKEKIEMHPVSETASIYSTEEHDELIRNTAEEDIDYTSDNNINPEFRSDLPDSDFKTDFFHSENIQDLVFSIPAQFRTFLQEPPDWINKDYW